MKSTNYMKFKNIFFLIVLYICYNTSFSQMTLYSYGFSAGPGFGFKLQNAKNSNRVPNSSVNFQQLSDSIKKTDHFRFGYDIGANIILNNGGQAFWSIGLQYRTMGFRRVIEGLHFLDTLQYFGMIDTKSDNGSKDARFKYIFHVIEIPLTYSQSMQKVEKLYDDFTWFLSVGLTPSFLVSHSVWARLYGFDIDGVNQLSGQKDLVLTYNRFNLYGNIGAKFMFRHPENDLIKFSVSPTFYIPLMSMTSADAGLNMRIPAFHLHAGVNFVIQ